MAISKPERAEWYARGAHAAVGRKRNYCENSNAIHLQEVAELTEHYGGDLSHITAAWLYRTLEETQVTTEQLAEVFGKDVADIVFDLSDLTPEEYGDRAARKAMYRYQLAASPAGTQTIKLAVVCSKVRDIDFEDPRLAKAYLKEQREMVGALSKGNADLRLLAESLVRASLQEISENAAGGQQPSPMR